MPSVSTYTPSRRRFHKQSEDVAVLVQRLLEESVIKSSERSIIKTYFVQGWF